VIYFFSRGPDFVQCEIYPGPPHVLTLVTPGGEQPETHDSSEALDDRWCELTRQLKRDGWQGPFGRDGRS
jgi:hypothetical protein